MYKENIELIKKYYQPYYDLITRVYQPQKDGEALSIKEIDSVDGSKNLILYRESMEINMHSLYNPSIESERWGSNIDYEGNLIIVIGGGYYYHIDELLKQVEKNQTVIIVEPSIAVFVSAMHNINLKKYLENQNIVLLLSDNPDEVSEGIVKIIMSRGFQSFEIYSLMSYNHIFSQFQAELRSSLSELLRLLDINLVTEVFWAQRWVHNQMKNIRFIKDGYPISALFGKFINTPAIIVGAGPSLEKHLEFLRENQDRFLIFSAGSSVNILEKNGIEAHFQVAIDGGEGEDRIIGGIKSTKTNLAFYPTISDKSLDMFKGRKMWFKGNSKTILDYFEEYADINTEQVEMGPSCVHAAMDMALKLGCRPLIFIGQDLAYTNEQLYAEGAVLFDTVKDDQRTKVVVDDMYGNKTVTNNAFLAIRLYFENYIRQHKDGEYINCTEGGLVIKGMQNATFKETVANFYNLQESLFEKINKECLSIDQGLKTGMNLGRKIREFVENIKLEAGKIEEKNQKRLNLVNEVLENLNSIEIQKIKAIVDQINDITGEIESGDIHHRIIHFKVAAYNLSIRVSTHSKVEGLSNLREKYRILFNGLQNQYLFYKAIVQTLVSAADETEKIIQGDIND